MSYTGDLFSQILFLQKLEILLISVFYAGRFFLLRPITQQNATEAKNYLGCDL